MTPHTHRVQIYYEDTDLSGSVYHANYLRYFERAREHLLGADELLRLWEEDGIGFVVYKVDITYREPAKLGDILEIRTTVKADGRYRAMFAQSAWRTDAKRPCAEGDLQLVCVDLTGQLVPIPQGVLERLGQVNPT